MELRCLLILLYCIGIIHCYNHPEPGQVSCQAVEFIHDDEIEEIFYFNVPFWQNEVVNVTTDRYNIDPMIGFFNYRFSFCNTINITSVAEPITNWGFGYMVNFFQYDPIVPPPFDYGATKEFSQFYEFGDTHPPCGTPRSARVDIYCGREKANCSQVPGSIGDHCVSGISTNPGFCLCSVMFNNTNLCNGLVLGVLSNKCPTGVPQQLHPGTLPLLPRNVAAIVIGTILGMVLIAFLVGVLYNRMNGKTGYDMIPFYDKCTGSKGYTNTETAPPPTSYGTLI